MLDGRVTLVGRSSPRCPSEHPARVGRKTRELHMGCWARVVGSPTANLVSLLLQRHCLTKPREIREQPRQDCCISGDGTAGSCVLRSVRLPRCHPGGNGCRWYENSGWWNHTVRTFADDIITYVALLSITHYCAAVLFCSASQASQALYVATLSRTWLGTNRPLDIPSKDRHLFCIRTSVGR